MENRQVVIINTRSGGFSLIGAIVSTLILATGVIIVCSIVLRCCQDNSRGAEYEVAYRLVDEVLSKIAPDKVAELYGESPIKGDFANRYPGYSYELEITLDAKLGLYKMKATVSWQVDKRQYQVYAETVICEMAVSG